MNRITGLGAGGCAAVIAALAASVVPAQASAVPRTDTPPPAGDVQVCDRSGYLFSVYADGPSMREDDLAGLSKSGECTDWAPVLPGNYNIGFGVRTTSTQDVVIQARVRRDDHVFYKVFNREGVIAAAVGAGDKIEVDLFIPQG